MIRFLAFCAAVATFAACNDWTEMETVDSKVEKPWEQDPALWAEYTAALRAYKQSEHFIVYARLHNSPEKASSEQDFMRCLPDSLDIVTLTNADNFSKFDAEDMDVMREKGTKVLYQVDYAARAEEFADMQAKLLLAAEISAPLLDEDRTEFAAVDEMSRRVIEFGPLGGLAAYNISKDYYHAEMNYQTIRGAIQTLNPAK